MAVDLAFDLWSELKRFIQNPDRADAADALVNLLVDNDYHAEDIRAAFKGDNDVKRALQSFLDDEDDGLEDEDEDDYDDSY